MRFKAEIKSVSTTKKDDDVEAKVVLQFLVRRIQDQEALFELLQMQEVPCAIEILPTVRQEELPLK